MSPKRGTRSNGPAVDHTVKVYFDDLVILFGREIAGISADRDQHRVPTHFPRLPLPIALRVLPTWSRALLDRFPRHRWKVCGR